jgi:hypothetical protein
MFRTVDQRKIRYNGSYVQYMAKDPRAPGAVKGAVDEFALSNGLTVDVTYREPNWPSKLVVKPSAFTLSS